MKSVVRMLGAALLATLVSLLMTAGAWAQEEQQQSLGDVARQEKAKKPKKVVTDEDLPQGTATSGSDAASSSGTATTKDEASTDAKEGEGTAAAEGDATMTKQQEADAAKSKLEDLKQNEAATERGLKRLEEKLADETDEGRRELYTNALQHGQANLAEFRKKRAEAEKEAAEKEAAAKDEQQKQQPQQPPQ